MNNPLYINRILVHPKMGRCDVTFRQGLNVILSEDVLNISEEITDQNDKNLNENKSMDLRNSTGKTTFIHLVEYAFGKDSFIDNEYEENRNLFQGTYVIAEFSVNGNRYTVSRSILDNDIVILYKDWVAESLIDGKNNQKIHSKTDLEGYISFFEWEIYHGTNYFKDTQIVGYRAIMNFIIRDQFFGFTNYYSGLKMEQAEFSRTRLDFLFGLTTPEKLSLKDEISKLTSDKKLLSNEYTVLNKYLLQILKNTPASIKKEIKKNERSINKLKIELEKYNDEVMTSETIMDNEKSIKSNLESQSKMVLNDITAIKSRIKNYSSTLNEIDNELSKLNHISVSMSMLNPFQYMKCPVFMEDINFKSNANHVCPLIESDEEKNKNNEIIEARKKLLEYEKKDLQRALVYLDKQLIASTTSYSLLIKDIHDVNLKIESKEKKVIIMRDYLRDQIKELEYENKTFEHQISQYLYLDNLKKEKNAKSNDIKIKKAELSKSSSSIDRIIEIYNEIIEFLSRNSREGTIDSKSFEPSILFKNNQKDTGAGMKSIAIIAFDLTMLTLSLEGKSQNKYLPYMDFLVHDSPKRNDIDLDMYKKVFDYVITLEETYLPLGTGFQYIITTLDTSKKVLDNKDKYVRLTLDNSGDGGKLFGTTINI